MEKSYLVKLPLEAGYLTEYNKVSGFIAWNTDIKNARHYTIDEAVLMVGQLYDNDNTIKQVVLINKDGSPVMLGNTLMGFSK